MKQLLMILGLFTLLFSSRSYAQQTWIRTYGGPNYDWSNSVQQASDGGYIISGSTNSFGAGSYDVYLVKTDSQGDTLWTRTYGGSHDDRGYSVQQTSDGGCIIAGYTSSFGEGYDDVYLIRTDASGDTLWTRTYGGTANDYGYSVQQTSDGGYITGGYTSSFGAGVWDVYLIKTDANGNVGVEGNPPSRLPPSAFGLRILPNPFVSYATVPGHLGERFKLYDVMGRMVGTYKGDRIGEGLTAGVYFLKGEGQSSKPLRVVKVR